MKNETSENRREFMTYASKIAHEWIHHLEMFSRPQVIENSRQHLLLRKAIYRKQSLGAPEAYKGNTSSAGQKKYPAT